LTAELVAVKPRNYGCVAFESCQPKISLSKRFHSNDITASCRLWSHANSSCQ